MESILGQFEDVSKTRKAFCWKYCLLDKANGKAKCKVKISEGKYCDKVISAKSGTKGVIEHLKRLHGMTPTEKNAENDGQIGTPEKIGTPDKIGT